jgi:hypothetical protein
MSLDRVPGWLEREAAARSTDADETLPDGEAVSRFPRLDQTLETMRVQAVDAEPEPDECESQPTTLDRVRLLAEEGLIQDLTERFGLDELLEGYEAQGRATHEYQEIVGRNLRVTPVLAPRLHKLFEETKSALCFEHPVELFIVGQPTINAAAIHAPEEGFPHAVQLTAGAIERMTDDELRFVLGHELGHLWFKHYRVILVHIALTDSDGESAMPPLLARHLESWDRLAELSADRAGLLGSHDQLDTVVSAFFKMETGLGPEHLSFDIQSFLGQLSELQSLGRSEVLSRYSHPVTPVRVRALQLFSAAYGPDWASRRDSLDAQVAELARVMDFEVSAPEDVHARDFLLAGGLLAATADGQGVSEKQWQLLVQFLLPLVADPEEALERFDRLDEVELLFVAASEWLRENTGGERFALFDRLCHLIALNGEIHGQEKEFLLKVAELLGMPEKAATESMYEVLRGYLQQRGVRNRPRLAVSLT